MSEGKNDHGEILKDCENHKLDELSAYLKQR